MCTMRSIVTGICHQLISYHSKTTVNCTFLQKKRPLHQPLGYCMVERYFHKISTNFYTTNSSVCIMESSSTDLEFPQPHPEWRPPEGKQKVKVSLDVDHYCMHVNSINITRQWDHTSHYLCKAQSHHAIPQSLVLLAVENWEWHGGNALKEKHHIPTFTVLFLMCAVHEGAPGCMICVTNFAGEFRWVIMVPKCSTFVRWLHMLRNCWKHDSMCFVYRPTDHQALLTYTRKNGGALFLETIW